MLEPDDRAFIDDFESLRFPIARFDHPAHVRLAWALLQQAALPEAMIRFRDALKRFAAHHGKDGLYHETVTFAFLFLIHERIRAGEAARSWVRFATDHPELFDREDPILRRLYPAAVLASEDARRRFVLWSGYGACSS